MINYVLSLTKSSKYLRVSIGVDQRIFDIFTVFLFFVRRRKWDEDGRERGEERGRRGRNWNVSKYVSKVQYSYDKYGTYGRVFFNDILHCISLTPDSRLTLPTLP